MKDKYKESIYNLVHLSKAKMSFDGVYIDQKQLEQDINILWDLYNKYQELIDQNKEYTLEEVKKEWEALDFEFCYHPNQHNILNIFKCDTIVIHIWKDRTYDFDSCNGSLPIKLHQLLTKTFKALETKDE